MTKRSSDLMCFLASIFSHIIISHIISHIVVFHHWPFVCDLSFMISDFCTLYSLTVS